MVHCNARVRWQAAVPGTLGHPTAHELMQCGEATCYLQLGSGEVVYAQFGKTRACCKLGRYLDEDHTKQQLLGQCSLYSKRMQLSCFSCTMVAARCIVLV